MTTLLFGCDPTGDIGVAPLTPVGTFYTDTLTIRTSTVLADSVRTTSPDNYLTGRYVDPIFGTVTASSFVQFSLEARLNLDATAVFDSLVLRTPYNYSYGDTTKVQTLSIHRLREQLVPLKSYYNDSKLAYDDAPLATKSFSPKPYINGNSNLNIRLPDALGKELFALSGKDVINFNEEFAKVLNGLAIIPGVNNTAVLGLPAANGDLRLQLWFHTKADTTAQGLPIRAVVKDNRNGVSLFRLGFNRVTADRSGTPLAGLKPLVPLPAGNGPTYVQEALGIFTKIEIPYLKLLGKGTNIAINRAELSIKPEQTTSTSITRLNQFMVLLETNSTNRVAYRPGSNYAAIVQQDALAYEPRLAPQVAEYDFRAKNYTFKLTTQLGAILTGFSKNNSFLVAPIYTNLIPDQGGTRYQSQLNNRVNRLLLSAKKEDLKLIVFYTQARE